MSMMCGYEIYFHAYHSPVDLLFTLWKQGWNFNINGKICFLPFGEEDPFDAVVNDIDNYDFFINQMKNKSAIGEFIMLSMVFEDTEIGGDFMFDSKDFCLNISLNMNRIKISKSNLTDYGWYDLKIVIPLLNAGYEITRIVAEDIGSDGETVYKKEDYIPF